MSGEISPVWLRNGVYVLGITAERVAIARADTRVPAIHFAWAERFFSQLADVRVLAPSGHAAVLTGYFPQGAMLRWSFEAALDEPGLFHWRLQLENGETPFLFSPPGAELLLSPQALTHLYTQQAPMAAGLVYLHEGRLLESTVFYLQDFTALNAYFAWTKTRPAGGNYPAPADHLPKSIVGHTERGLGLWLPAAVEVPPHQTLVLSDAYLLLQPGQPFDDPDAAERFLSALWAIYKHLSRPETYPVDWRGLAERTLHDLDDPHDRRIWVELEGRPFLRAYVNDQREQAELITQLDVLTALRCYRRSCGDGRYGDLERCLVDTLPYFYSEDARAMLNQPIGLRPFADSWYFITALVDMAELARDHVHVARRLLVDSLDTAVETARRYNYRFPIFFDPTGRTEPPSPDPPIYPPEERDVAGAFAYLMLEAAKLSGDPRYRREAEVALVALEGGLFSLAYELHVTALAALACARMYRFTGDRAYLRMSYLPLADFFRHTWLWECTYGLAAQYRTFFGLLPMTYAQVITPKEQYESWRHLRRYLALAYSHLPEAISALVSEFYRHTLVTMAFTYAPNMPSQAVAHRPRVRDVVTEIVPELYVPLEDLRDGWEPSGQIAQEIYGAGMALRFAAEAYWPLSSRISVYGEYPIVQATDLTFTLGGSPDEVITLCVEGPVQAVVEADDPADPLPAQRRGNVLQVAVRGGGRYTVVPT